MTSKKNRLAFLGSDEIALPILRFLNSTSSTVDVVAILTQPDRRSGRGGKKSPNEIKKWADENSIPCESPEKPSIDECEWLKAKNVDILLVMAYGHILRREFLDFAPRGCYNLHASILPKYRGASPIETAIAMGEKETGVTLMKVIPRMDAGPIIDIEQVEITDSESGPSLRSKISEACVPVVSRNLDQILYGTVQELTQNESLASYCRKLCKDDANLDFNLSAEQLVNRIRAFVSWPGANFLFESQKIRIGEAEYCNNHLSLSPGETIMESNNKFCIGTSDGLLIPKTLQRPGGKMLKTEDFFRGFEFPFGCRLNSFPSHPLLKSKLVE